MKTTARSHNDGHSMNRHQLGKRKFVHVIDAMKSVPRGLHAVKSRGKEGRFASALGG